MSVCFITRDFNGRIPGGCAYYRCFLPMSVLRGRIEGTLGHPAFDPIRGFGIKDTPTTGVFGYKTAVLKLLMDKPMPAQIRLAQQNAGQRIIVDVDDYYEGLTEANAAFHATHPDTNKRTNRDIYRQVILAADTITVSTPFLLEHYSKMHGDVRLVRNGVNIDAFNPVQVQSKGYLRVGWTGSTAYRNGDLEMLGEWLPDWLRANNAKMVHVGADAGNPLFSEMTGVPLGKMEELPIVPMTMYPNSLKFDIGLVPLREIDFNRAKSCIKGLEYAAAGIPFVASPLPEYEMLHESGIGRLAATPDEWVAHMDALAHASTRREEARNQLNKVGLDHSIQSRAEEWYDVLTI